MSKHIFITFYDLSLGGIQRKIVDVVNYMGSSAHYRDYTPHIILRREKSFSFRSQIKNKQVIIHQFRPVISQRLDKLFFSLYFLFLTLKYSPKVIISYLHNSSFYAILAKITFFWKRIKVVIAQDNILSYENSRPYAKKTYPNYLIKIYYPLANTIIAQSKAVKKDLIDNYGIKPKKIKILPNWTRPFNSMVKIDKKTIDLIYCGRFAHQKNPLKMIDIVKNLQKDIPKLNVLMIGSGVLKKEMIRKAQKNKLNITFKAPIHNIEQELKKSKIFILTSKFEGYPITLLEAMNLKVVPVVLNYPSANDQILNKETGYVEKNIIEMTKRIKQLLENDLKREKVASRAQEHTLKHNNMEIINEFLNLALH